MAAIDPLIIYIIGVAFIMSILAFYTLRGGNRQ